MGLMRMNINCPKCRSNFLFEAESSGTFSRICPNAQCSTLLRIEVSDSNVAHVAVSASPEIDSMWIEYGKKLVTDTIGGLDDRAKFMITTCATLIVIQLGLSFAFKVQAYSLVLTPQFFLVISAAFFAMSLHQPSRTRAINLQSPNSIQTLYIQMTMKKSRWHLLGFSFFIAGLLAFAIMTLVQK
jgi:hypothetical protein